MNKAVIVQLVGIFLQLKFLEGYRTYIAAAGLFATGVYQLTQGNAEGAVSNVFLGLAALGIRSKLADDPPAQPPTPSNG